MKSGVVGVIWNSKQEIWVARITKKGERKLLYAGPSMVEAIAARRKEDAKKVCADCGGKIDLKSHPSASRCGKCRKTRAKAVKDKWKKRMSTSPPTEKPTDGIPWPASR